MDILLRIPKNEQVLSPAVIIDTLNRQPTAQETAIWAMIESMKGGYSQLPTQDVGVPNSTHRLLVVTTFGVTLADLDAAITQYGLNWQIIHAEGEGMVDIIDPATNQPQLDAQGNVMQQSGHVVFRKAATVSLLSHTPDIVTVDITTNVETRTAATMPSIGHWAGKAWTWK